MCPRRQVGSLVFGEEAGEDEDHDDLGQLRRLELHQPEGDPALRPGHQPGEDEGRGEEDDDQAVKIDRERDEELVVDDQDEEQDQERDADPDELADVVGAGKEMGRAVDEDRRRRATGAG